MGASFLENQPHTAVSAGIVSDIFRRIASLFFVVPAGIFLGGVAVLTLGELPRTEGWLSETGAAAGTPAAETETAAEKPKKGMLRTALTTLRTVKGIAEFGAAVAALAEFVGPLL